MDPAHRDMLQIVSTGNFCAQDHRCKLMASSSLDLTRFTCRTYYWDEEGFYYKTIAIGLGPPM